MLLLVIRMCFSSVGGDVAVSWGLLSADLGLEVNDLHNPFLEQPLQYYMETKDLHLQHLADILMQSVVLCNSHQKAVMLEQIDQGLKSLSN